MHAPFAKSTMAKVVSGRRARHATGTVDSSPSTTASALGLPQDGSPKASTGSTEVTARMAASSASPVPCTRGLRSQFSTRRLMGTTVQRTGPGAHPPAGGTGFPPRGGANFATAAEDAPGLPLLASEAT